MLLPALSPLCFDDPDAHSAPLDMDGSPLFVRWYPTPMQCQVALRLESGQAWRILVGWLHDYRLVHLKLTSCDFGHNS